MNHETVERVARAIHRVLEKDNLSVYVGDFGDGEYVDIDGYVNLLDCAADAIKAYRQVCEIVPETPEGELKPCPFCGGEAKNYSRYSNIGRLLHFAGCEACSAETSHHEGVEQAIDAWNRREGQ